MYLYIEYVDTQGEQETSFSLFDKTTIQKAIDFVKRVNSRIGWISIDDKLSYTKDQIIKLLTEKLSK